MSRLRNIRQVIERTGSGVPVLAMLLLAGGMGATASAGEIKYPKDKPQVSLTVPDGWTANETDIGLELIAPEKNSFIVADLTKQDKGAVDAWKNRAAEKLKAFGIKFDDKDAGAGAKSAPPAPSPSFESTGKKPPETFTFSGTPSLTSPGGANDNSKPGVNSLENLTGLGPTGESNKPPFKVALYSGTSLNGKPTDVQLVIFRLKKQYFVMDQQSGSDDSRAVAIVQSVRSVR